MKSMIKKTLKVPHSSFGPKVKYRTFHQGIYKAMDQMTWYGELYFFFLLAICRWNIEDYDHEGVVFSR